MWNFLKGAFKAMLVHQLFPQVCRFQEVSGRVSPFKILVILCLLSQQHLTQLRNSEAFSLFTDFKIIMHALMHNYNYAFMKLLVLASLRNSVKQLISKLQAVSHHLDSDQSCLLSLIGTWTLSAPVPLLNPSFLSPVSLPALSPSPRRIFAFKTGKLQDNLVSLHMFSLVTVIKRGGGFKNLSILLIVHI